MRPAAPVPFISVENVQAALDALGYASAPLSPNALERLLLVEQALADPAMPSSALAREVILYRLLVNTIRDQLALHRAAHGLDAPDEQLPLPQALDRLQADGRTEAPILIGWSILFHRYVCVTLDLTADALAAALMITVRTVHRYQVGAVRRLAQWLTEAERAARQSQRRRWLIAQLPTQVPTALVGLNDVWTTLDRLRERQGPFHVVVTGPHGIGKTTLAQEYVRALIEADQVDQLVWLDRPSSVEQARQIIAGSLIPDDAPMTLREALQLVSPVVVVLDEAEKLLADALALPDLLNELSAASVFMLNVDYVPLSVAHAHVIVPELSEAETLTLTGLVLAGADEPADAIGAFGRTIWRAVGGNPLLIRLSASTSQFVETRTFAPVGALDRIYGRSFAALDPSEVRALAMIALCPPGEVALSRLGALWPSEAPQAAVEALMRRSWLDRVSRERGTLLMGSAARRFLSERSAADWRGLIDELLSALEQPAETSPALRDELLYLLRQEALPCPDGWRTRALHRLARVDLLGRQRPYWRAVLEQEQERAGTLDVPLQIAYAVILRRAADWPKAMDLLGDAIRQAGMSGQFLDQARAMLELAVLCRYRGEYERARMLLAKVEKTGRRYRDAALSERAQLELAQIHVDAGDSSVALRLLDDAPDSLRRLALRAEALFLTGDVERAAGQVERAFALSDSDPVTLARLHSIIGRGFEAQGQFEQARDRFAIAVTLLEQADDPFALARARSNLASARIRLDLLTGTAELLRRAETVQRVLKDRAGLLATCHNQRLLLIRSSR